MRDKIYVILRFSSDVDCNLSFDLFEAYSDKEKAEARCNELNAVSREPFKEYEIEEMILQ